MKDEKILIVDDEESIRESFNETLKDKYTILTTTSGEEAIKIVDKEKPNLVLLDIRLPGMDGIETLQMIKKIDNNLPVIVISVVNTVNTAIKAMKLGADDYIIKPFNVDEIIITIQEVLEKQRLSLKLAHIQDELLMQTKKLADVGKMSAGIAHEVRNLLTGVLGFARLLSQEKLTEDDSRKRDLKIIEKAAVRSMKMLDNLLKFSRTSEIKFERININPVINDTLLLLRNSVTLKGVKVICDLKPNLPKVMGSANQLQQVFTNIILNAKDAMAEKGVLIIFTQPSTKGDLIEIIFRDNGCGIPEDIIKKIKEPFFTTKDSREGVGLGLTISHRIIECHQGSIYVESEANKGTTFIVSLPISSKTPPTLYMKGDSYNER